jgi:DNA replication protein DnaC
MVIFGNNGSGKSHTAHAICSWSNRMAINLPLVTDNGVGARLATAEFHNWPNVVERLKCGEWELIEEMIPVNLLVIDDLGAEHDPSKMGIEKLYLLLERRETKWTVITTNVPPMEWENRFEKRIASRFLRNFVQVPLDETPDYKA